MARRKSYKQPATSALLMTLWLEAAEKWKRLRSDPTLRACMKARANWYIAVYGEIPPIRQEAE